MRHSSLATSCVPGRPKAVADTPVTFMFGNGLSKSRRQKPARRRLDRRTDPYARRSLDRRAPVFVRPRRVGYNLAGESRWQLPVGAIRSPLHVAQPSVRTFALPLTWLAITHTPPPHPRTSCLRSSVANTSAKTSNRRIGKSGASVAASGKNGSDSEAGSLGFPLLTSPHFAIVPPPLI